VFDVASGWTLVAGITGIAVVAGCLALVWLARASGTRRGSREPVPTALVAVGLILVALGISLGGRLTSYALIGAGVLVAVLSVFFESRSADK
jgi:hypothetical protein